MRDTLAHTLQKKQIESIDFDKFFSSDQKLQLLTLEEMYSLPPV